MFARPPSESNWRICVNVHRQVHPLCLLMFCERRFHSRVSASQGIGFDWQVARWTIDLASHLRAIGKRGEFPVLTPAVLQRRNEAIRRTPYTLTLSQTPSPWEKKVSWRASLWSEELSAASANVLSERSMFKSRWKGDGCILPFQAHAPNSGNSARVEARCQGRLAPRPARFSLDAVLVRPIQAVREGLAKRMKL